MISLALRTDPHATIALVRFIITGVLACVGWLWWLWWTEGTCGGCGRSPRECRCYPEGMGR